MGELIRREAAANPLDFSGERLTSGVAGQIQIEHYHRYLVARDLARGCDVLDIAAGEGYGAALLAQVARSVVAVEIDPASVAAAAAEFARPNLRFVQGDARAIPLPDASIDLVVSFETLEHFAEQAQFLAEIKRVLRPGGALLISTPDRDVYSAPGAPANPYHIKELTRAEFEALLAQSFAHTDITAQRVMIGSVMIGAELTGAELTGAAGRHARTYEARGPSIIEASDGLPRAPYLIALSSDAPGQRLPGSLFVQRSDLDTDMQVRETAERAAIAASERAIAAERLAADWRAHAERRDTDLAQAGEALQSARTAAATAEALAQDLGKQAAQARVALARDQAEIGELTDRVLALERLRAGAAEQADTAQAALAAAAAHHLGLLDAERQRLAATEDRAGSLAVALEAEQARQRATEAALHYASAQASQSEAEAAYLHRRLHAIEASSLWRATGIVRTVGRRYPGPARRARQTLQFLWWTATLQLGARYMLWRRARALRVAPAPMAALPLAVPVPAPPALPPAQPVPPTQPAPSAQTPPPTRIVTSDAPLVSLIIATYGQAAVTLRCLTSLAANPPDSAIEVIVVDDAYPDPDDARALRAIAGIRLVRNAENLGFLRSCNKAAALATGTYLHFLNNDTELRPGAIDRLVHRLQTHPGAGMAGSKLLFPDDTLQEAGGIIWQDASGWNFGRGEDPARPEFNYVCETDYCSGASIMLPRALFEQLGGFDEALAPAYYEDVDLAFRIRAHGLKMLYEPASVVVHHEGASHGTDTGAGIKAYQVVNQQKIAARWGAVLAAQHFLPGKHVLRARSHARHRTVMLIIDHYTPEPDRDAGSRYLLNTMTALAEAGWLLKFWPSNRVHHPVYAAALEAIGIEVIDQRWPGDFNAWIMANGAELDHALLVRPDLVDQYLLAVTRLSGAVVSYSGVDLHFARLQRQAALEGDEALLREAALLERLERRIWASVDLVLYPSQEEAETVRRLVPGADVRAIIPFTFPVAPPREHPPADPVILFVAGFAHRPNIDAACFLISEVMPLVRAAVPGVTVLIAGSNPSESVRALASDTVTVTGYVTDKRLTELYASARAAAVPLRFGAGVKGKVVEALSHGLPLVTTPTGAQGIPGLETVVPVHELADALAQSLIALLTDDAAWRRQSAAQRSFAGDHFSKAALQASVLAAFDSVPAIVATDANPPHRPPSPPARA